jgi:cyclic beta-1,2-glucan synthetase
MEREAWDGAWYRRATYDDGSWLGAKDSGECVIDSIAQSWAALSGAADPARAATAMASLQEQLVRGDDGLALLFTPPFDKTARDPGYIKGYPPGIRENGGQYSHAAMWAVLALAKMGEGGKAVELFSLLNPVNHARTQAEAERYRVEPYVVAADVYSVAPHVGRGGWSWYTGAAGWMYQAGIEGILGIRREGAFIVVKPCIPAEWPGFEATLNVQGSRFEIKVVSGAATHRATVDGAEWGVAGGAIRLALDGAAHIVRVELQAM